MRVPNVLDMAGDAARRFGPFSYAIEGLRVMTARASGSIDIGAQKAILMTRVARQHFGDRDGLSLVNARNANTIPMNGVELSSAPLLRLTWRDAVLFQERRYFRFGSQLFCVQAAPDPDSIFYGITISPSMRGMHGLAVIEILVLIVMALRARFQRCIHGTEGCASMFRMAVGAGYAGRAVSEGDIGDEAFRVMTSRAVGAHLLAVRDADSDCMTRGARTTIRLSGNRGR